MNRETGVLGQGRTGSPALPVVDNKDDATEVAIFQSTAEEAEENHHFTRTNPLSVLLLAGATAVLAVLSVAGLEETVTLAIDEDYIAPPPALQPLVGQDQ